MTFDALHPTEQDLRAIDVHQLLPQQEPFVMISNLVYFDERKTVTELLVSPDNILLQNGKLTAEGLMENIAQTCAARIGYVNKYIRLKGIQIGYIGAVRNMEAMKLPQVGDVITTTVDVLEEVFGMSLAHAEISLKGQVIVTTEMKIAVKDEELNKKKRWN